MSDQKSKQRRLTELARSQQGVMTIAQVRALGFGPSEVRTELARGRWEQVARGVYRISAAPSTWEQSVWAACLESGGVASHRTAAWLHGLDGLGRLPPSPVEVVVAYDSKRTARHAHVRHSRTLLPSHTSKQAGVPKTNLARTLLDLSEVLAPETLELAFDSALRKQPDLRLWLRRLLRGLPRRGHRGIAHLDALVAAHGTSVDSALEVKVLRLIRAARLPRPQTGVDVVEAGLHVAKLDFAWPTNRPQVALMAQSERWHANTRRWRRDLAQTTQLTALGWRVLQCTMEDVARRPDELARNLRRALEGFTATAEVRGYVAH